MSANNLQTNRNASRYFFATSENGEQTLGLQYGTTGGATNLSTMAVTISGSQGNGVIVNQAPQYVATEFMVAEDALITGTNSSYFTMSTINNTLVGVNMSIDRNPGSGLACIEAYSGNGAYKGFEFLSRGVNSALQSTLMDSYLSTIGSPGAIAKIGGNGQLVAGQSVVGISEIALSAQDTGGGVGCFNVSDLSGGQARTRWSWFKTGVETGGNTGTNLNLGAYNDAGNFLGNVMQITRATPAVSTINSYAYPQAVVAIPPSAISPGATSVGNATPVVILTIPASGAGLIPGANYLTDINITLSATNPLAVPVFLQIGVRLGGNGAFNYENPITLLAGVGIPVNCAVSINQITNMGSTNTNIDIIAYQQSSAPGTISVTATTSSGSPSHLLKMIT